VIKLKNILAEGFAWERKADGSLPTIADTTAAYERKLQEEAELNMPFEDGEDVDVDAEETVEETAKPDYIDADGDGNEKESMKKAFADKEDSDFSDYSLNALTDMKVNLSRYEGNEEDIEKINREIDKRKQNESILITKGGLQALRETPLIDRIRKNYIGNK
jgi:hypothetical protein